MLEDSPSPSTLSAADDLAVTQDDVPRIAASETEKRLVPWFGLTTKPGWNLLLIQLADDRGVNPVVQRAGIRTERM